MTRDSLAALGVVLLLVLPVAQPAAAQAPAPDSITHGIPERSDAAITDVVPESEIDRLFAELKRQRDPRRARIITEKITAVWRDSGSATVNLLMQWAEKAIAERRHSAALDLLDQVVVLKPDYAEGWNRRATLHYSMKNHGKSMADISHVLALEPRHFGALAGMAAILRDSGEDRLALKAFQQMLEVFPANRDAQRRVGELTDKLSGEAA
jgi:tetratricopeptide (TPR) repeat protein